MRFVGAEDLAVEEDAEVALLAEEGEEIRALSIGGDGDGEGDQDLFAGEVFVGPGGGGVGGVGADFLATVGVVAFRGAGEEELQVVVDLGQGADGRAGGADVVFLLDGDGRRDAVDVIDVGLVHAVEELPDVRREGLDVAALALGIEGVEGERGLAGARGAGDDGELAEREIEVEALEAVLAGAADGDDGGGRGGLLRGHGGSLGRTAWSASGVCGAGRAETRWPCRPDSSPHGTGVFSKAAAISAAGSLPSSGERRWRRTAGKSDWTWSG